MHGVSGTGEALRFRVDQDIDANGLVLDNQNILPKVSDDENPFALKLEKEQEGVKNVQPSKEDAAAGTAVRKSKL